MQSRETENDFEGLSLIWASQIPRKLDQYVLFRKTFCLEEAQICRIRLFADTYYNLYVDGEFLHRGPIRRHESQSEFDELHCCLAEGNHTVAVMVHWLGQECAGHRMGAPAFWCQIRGNKILVQTDASWKAIFCDAFRTDGVIFSHYDYCQNLDLQAYPSDWMQPEFDDSHWDAALQLCMAGSPEDVHQNYRKRRMKLFSYVPESGEILTRGTYRETQSSNVCYFDRMVSRIRTQTNEADGRYCVVGFCAVLSGTLKINYSNAEAGAELIVGYDDQLGSNGLPDPARMMRLADRFVLKQGSGVVQIVMPRGFRYLLIDVSGKCEIGDITAIREQYPYAPDAGFASDRPLWTDIYRTSLRTQRICTIDGFTDCVNRERVLWLGDAWLDCRGSYYADPDQGLLLTTLFEHAAGQSASGALGGYCSSDLKPDWLYIPSYNLMYLNMLCDYLLYTGCSQDILSLKETAAGVIRFILHNCDGDGVFDPSLHDCCNYWDWGYEEPEGRSLKTSAFFIYTVERMRSFSFFDGIITQQLLEQVEKMREACRELFWDPCRRVFHDGCTASGALHPLATQCANALAVLSDICPEECREELLMRILSDSELDDIPIGENQSYENFIPNYEKILPCGTMYSAAFVCMALFTAGYAEQAAQFAANVWEPFRFFPTLPELRRNGVNNTMCHGWSGAPTFLFPEYLLGLRPTKPGWKELLVEIPDISLDVLPSAKGCVITPYGRCAVAWSHIQSGSMCVYIDLPDQVTALVKWKNTQIKIEGKNSLTLFLIQA